MIVRYLLILFLFISFNSFSQEKNKGSKSSGPRATKPKEMKQSSHFKKEPKDPNLKDNGTKYWLYRRKHSKNAGSFYGEQKSHYRNKRDKVY